MLESSFLWQKAKQLVNEHMTKKTIGASAKHFADIVFKKGENYSRIYIIIILLLLKDKPERSDQKLVTLSVGLLELAVSVYLQIGLTFWLYLTKKLTWHYFYVRKLAPIVKIIVVAGGWKNMMHILINHIVMSNIYQQTMKKQTPESFYMQFTDNKPLV